MGVIIAMPLRQTAKPDAGSPEISAPCEILFFTGVRYQRHDEDMTTAKKPARPAAGGPRNGTSRRRRG